MARSEKNLTAVFTDTADAIRAKKGTSAEICPLDFADEITSIPGGGTTLLTPNCSLIPLTHDSWTTPRFIKDVGWKLYYYGNDYDEYYALAEEHKDGTIWIWSASWESVPREKIVDSDGTIQPKFGSGTTIKFILPIRSPATISGTHPYLGACITGDGTSLDQKILNYNVEFYTMDNDKIGQTCTIEDCLCTGGC